MKRILIIEDEKPLREAFTFLLQSEGYEVDSAANGKEGLKKLKIFKPDVILLDMLMPVMNGLEFLQAAELLKKHPKVRTLLLSNLSDPISLDGIQQYGVTRALLKADLSPAELAAVIENMVTSD